MSKDTTPTARCTLHRHRTRRGVCRRSRSWRHSLRTAGRGRSLCLGYIAKPDCRHCRRRNRSANAAGVSRHHGLAGAGHARAFAEVAAAVALAGELSITGALAAGHFTDAHQRLRAAACSVKRWVVYQRERFPLIGHAPLVAAFSVRRSAFVARRIGFSRPEDADRRVLHRAPLLPAARQRRVQRLLDDSRYRPYRPVPRGLVTLRELAWVGVRGLRRTAWRCGSNLHWSGSLRWRIPRGDEPRVLRTRLAESGRLYLASHMVVIPLIDLRQLRATGESQVSGRPPDGLIWFLIVSYFNGVVVEGRKIRAPADEEPGVETYSALWGQKKAASIWVLAAATTAVFAASSQTDSLRAGGRLVAADAVDRMRGNCFDSSNDP